MDDERRLEDLSERRALAGIEIEVHVVGPVHVVTARVPLIQVDATQVDDPQQRRQVVDDRKVDDVPESCPIVQVRIHSGRGDGARFMKKNSPAAPWG